MKIKGIIYYSSDYAVGNAKLQQIVAGYERFGIPTTKCHYSKNGSRAEFENGDCWSVRYANDGARGSRWNVAYIERCIDYPIFRQVIMPAGCMSPFTAIHLFGEGDLHVDDKPSLPFR